MEEPEGKKRPPGTLRRHHRVAESSLSSGKSISVLIIAARLFSLENMTRQRFLPVSE